MALILGRRWRLLAVLTNGSRDALWFLRLDPKRPGTHFVHWKPCIGELCLTLSHGTALGLLVSNTLLERRNETVVTNPRL